jgi:molybdate transport system substrate-binding protein
MRILFFLCLFSIYHLNCSVVLANSLHVAVASNFSAPARDIAKRFEEVSGQKISLSFGSTGKHYIQIMNGAPFDMFLSADHTHPQKLIDQGYGQKESLYTYAIGRLALYSAIDALNISDDRILKTPSNPDIRFLAIANPKTAPYGKAAQDTLKSLDVWESWQHKIVRGNNITQAFQFAYKKTAQLGFVSFAQIKQFKEISNFWLVPENLHRRIIQQALILKPSQEATAFLEFLKTEEIQTLIQSYGYERMRE